MNLLLISFISFFSLFSQNNQSNKIEGNWSLVEYVGFKNEQSYPENYLVKDSSSVIISISKKDSNFLLCGMAGSVQFYGSLNVYKKRFTVLNFYQLPIIRVNAEHFICLKYFSSADLYKIKGDYLYLYFDDEDKYFKLKRINSGNRDEFFTTCESKDIYKIKLGPK